MKFHPHDPHIREKYADELMRRYVELRRWAADNWPNAEQPLIASDFVAGDRELHLLLGSRLHVGNRIARPGTGRYEDVTPMPWP